MLKIAVYGKGGIGKSTTTANLSSAFSTLGLKTMQIGCDPKADSTRLLMHGKEFPTILDLMRQGLEDLKLEDLVHKGIGNTLCVEAGGPTPGIGCAGLGIISALQKLEEFLGFKPLEIRNQEFAQKLSYNYKKSDKSEVDEKNQTTWLTLAFIESRQNAPESQFSQGNAQLAAHDIAVRAHTGDLREAEIHDILSKYGIAYSVVPKLDKNPIDAASMKVGEYPAIITTHRYNDMSRLVFNILHELGHIEKHMYGEDSEIFVSGDPYTTDSPKEREANLFAQNMLISQRLWDSMMNNGSATGLRFGNIVDQLRLLAAENNLDFNIVVWRWKYESHNYQLRGTRPVPIQ